MAFLNPFFLLGAFAALIPVLVHLVRRTRAVKVPFASLMFVRRIEQKTVRKRRLRNLLLLVLRCLGLLLLTLAFSRPYVTGDNPVSAATDQPSTVILIDGSYSMRYPGVFEKAVQEARRVINNAASNEQIALALFANNCEILRPLKQDSAEALALLDSAAPRFGPTDYLQAIQTANALLRDASRGRKEIHLISDFQESGWNKSAPPFKLAPGVRLNPIDISDHNARNVALLDVNAEPVIYSQKYSGKLVATIGCFDSSLASSEFSETASETVEGTVELKLNDLTVERRQVKVGVGAEETVEFSDFNVPEGANRAMIEITGDQFPIDNRFYFTIRRENQIKVLSIETASRGRSESFFLQQSLLAGDSNPYVLTVKTAGAADPTEIEAYKTVILNDVGGISVAVVDALKLFVERGGGLIIAAGRHTDAAEFNRKLAGVSPVELGEPVVGTAYALMSQVKTDHPIFSPFARSGRLTSTRIYGYHRSVPADRASVLTALDDGTPLVTEGLFGRGKVLLITTTLDTSWNDWPLSPIFLPVFNQMLDYLGRRESRSTYLVGQVLALPPDSDGSQPSVDNPNGKRVTDIRQSATGELSIDAAEPGIYRLRYRGHAEYLAANLDTRDSDLSRLDVAQFVAGLSPGGQGADAQPKDAGPMTPAEIEATQRLWLPLLLLALALFVAEALLARRIRLAKLVK